MNRTVCLAALLLLLVAVFLAPPRLAAQGGSLTLAAAAEMALAVHPTLRAGAARAGAADYAVAEARGQLRPQARIDASGTRFQQPMVVAPLHGFNPLDPPLFDHTLIQFQATVGLTLMDGGLRRAGVRRAEAGAQASDALLEGARATVIIEVATAWLNVAAGREALAAQEARSSALEAERDRVRQLVEVGRAAPLDALRVEAAREAGRADQAVARESVVAAEQALARLIGQSADRVRTAAIDPVRIAVPLPPTQTLIDAVRHANPEVAASAAATAQAAALAELSRGSWWPEVRLVGGYADYWSGAGRLTGEWQAGLKAGFPVWTGGTRRAASQRAALDIVAAEASHDAVLLRLATALDRAVAAEASAGARAVALVAAVAQYTEVVRIEQLALDAGAGTRRDWIVATADLLATRSALIAARHTQISARLDIARLTGSLSVATLSNMLETGP